MANENNPNSVCKSIFKSGENAPSKEVFTQKWVELINKIEKGKSVNFCKST